MYWFPLPFQLPVVIWPVQCWKRCKTQINLLNNFYRIRTTIYFLHKFSFQPTPGQVSSSWSHSSQFDSGSKRVFDIDATIRTHQKVFHMKEKCNMCKVCGSCIFGQLLKGFQPEGLYFGVCFSPARCGLFLCWLGTSVAVVSWCILFDVILLMSADVHYWMWWLCCLTSTVGCDVDYIILRFTVGCAVVYAIWWSPLDVRLMRSDVYCWLWCCSHEPLWGLSIQVVFPGHIGRVIQRMEHFVLNSWCQYYCRFVNIIVYWNRSKLGASVELSMV